MIHIQKDRIDQWQDCKNIDISKESCHQMYQDYLFEIWQIQECNGDLPEEFEGMQ
jgi:hypothetical protein